MPWLDSAFGPSDSDEFSASFTVPLTAANGDYTVGCSAGTNATGYDYRTGTFAEFSVTGGSSDTSPPSLSGVTITPTSPVAGEPITFTVNVSDPSGIQRVSIMVIGPFPSTEGTGKSMTVSTGYDMTGPTFSWSKSLEAGEYRLEIVASDNLSNEVQNNNAAVFTVQ